VRPASLSGSLRVRQLLVFDDGGEGVWLEAGTADECAVDLFFAEQGCGVLGLDAAAVEDAGGFGQVGVEDVGQFCADDHVGFDGHLWSGGFAGSDGPDRLVGDDQGVGCGGRYAGERALELGEQDLGGLAGFAFG